MDVGQFSRLIDRILRIQLDPSERYRGLAFAAKEELMLSTVRDIVVRNFEPVELWLSPGKGNAPEVPCLPITFNERVFGGEHREPLVIYRPEDWMYDWPFLEKKAFWSQLAMAYGMHDVIAITADVLETVRSMDLYLEPTPIGAFPVRVWTPKQQSLIKEVVWARD